VGSILVMTERSGNENKRLGDSFASGASQGENAKGSPEQYTMIDEHRHEVRHGEAQPASSPLSAAATSPSSATASSIPSTTIASLIQSAAKISILDADRSEGVRRHSSTNTQGKLFRDDEYDDLESLSLQSLQKQMLPAMPDEQDRKRFVVSSVLNRFGSHSSRFV
jgi:hypothetical protein